MKRYKFTAPHILSGLAEDAPVLAAFSGGADSAAMLDMLKKHCDKTGATLYAAHVNHGIRGAEADRDEDFCRSVAERYGIEIFVLKADVPSIAAERKLSVETAAREVRYDFFAEIMKKHSIPTLCVAHNADDNFETILFNISRGSGLSGVCGIPRTRDFAGGIIVRPILEINKSDIIEYCSENNIKYVTDSTNTDVEYSRNRIRSRVIPELKAICPSAENAAARLSESLRQDSLCLESMAEWFLSETREGNSIPTEKLNGSPAAISSRAVMNLYKEISEGVDIEYTHVKSVLELSAKAVPHSSLDLPAGVRAAVENGALLFTKDPLPPKNIVSEEFEYDLGEGSNIISQINAEIIIGNTEKVKNIYKKSMNFSIDSDRIIGTLKVRNRQAGDKIKVLGCSKSLKKLMSEKKIPQELRPRIPVICDDSGVIAVPFVAISDTHYQKDGKISPSLLTVRFNLL